MNLSFTVKAAYITPKLMKYMEPMDMLPDDWQFLNEAHRKNTEACLKEVAYWLEHPFSHDEVKMIFKRQREKREALSREKSL